MNFFYFFPLAFFIFCSEILDHTMSGRERKKTGVYKLTDKEKSLLQSWINTHYEKREIPLEQEATGKHAVLQENLCNSQFIRLSDQTLWKVDPENTPIAQGWITPVEIIVTRSKNTDYPYQLTNSLTGSSIGAEKIEKLTP
jgi:hypothetical protein